MLETTREAPTLDQHLHDHQCIIEHKCVSSNELSYPMLHDEYSQLKKISIIFSIQESYSMSVHDFVQHNT